MGLSDALQRRVRPHKEDEQELNSYDNGSESLEAESEGLNDSAEDEESQSAGSRDESTSDITAKSNEPHEDVGNISFGALAKAQEALGKRKRDPASEPDNLLEIRKKLKGSKHDLHGEGGEAAERKAGKKDTRDFGRPSKHAPAEMSSKKAVSRKREAVATTKREYRDPRFEALSGPLDETKIKKKYSFLDGYRDDEMKQLKDEIRKTKDPTAKETLKRALLSMESKKKTQQAKDQQQDVIRDHRAKEKELIKQGKKPFYLKKTEQKKLALIDKYSSMKGKQLDRAMERKRKKKTQRDRRHMPEARRGVDAE